MDTPLLEVSHLRVEARSRSGMVVAVDDLDLAIRPGEVLGLIGESGSGKTTTARAIVGLLERNVSVVGGDIRYRGDLVYGDGVDDRRRLRGRHIGFVFQSASSSLNPLLRIGTQLRQVLRANRPDWSSADVTRRLESVIGRMGFSDPERVLRAYPHQLSGGMRQRAAIAIAICSEPELVIADECTSALDVLVQADVVALLRELVADLGVAMIFVTHDLLLAGDLCSHILVMQRGHVVEQGSTQAVISRPQHPYTRALLDAVPSWNAPMASRAEGTSS